MGNQRLIQQAVLEMVAIIISVLLALFLSNWWQERQIYDGHTKTLTLLTVELEANKAEQEEAIAYYKDIIPKVAGVLKDGVTDEEAQDIMTYCCELMSSGTGRTAHEMAVMTGLYASLEPSIAAAIIAPFVRQEDLKDITFAMTNSLMDAADTSDPGKFLRSYYMFAATMTPSIEELLDTTNAAIKSIDEMS